MTPAQPSEVWSTLDRAHLARVARGGLEPVFAIISGAYLYGFASPDSDVDLRGAFLHPAAGDVSLERHTIFLALAGSHAHGPHAMAPMSTCGVFAWRRYPCASRSSGRSSNTRARCTASSPLSSRHASRPIPWLVAASPRRSNRSSSTLRGSWASAPSPTPTLCRRIAELGAA